MKDGEAYSLSQKKLTGNCAAVLEQQMSNELNDTIVSKISSKN